MMTAGTAKQSRIIGLEGEIERAKRSILHWKESKKTAKKNISYCKNALKGYKKELDELKHTA